MWNSEVTLRPISGLKPPDNDRQGYNYSGLKLPAFNLESLRFETPVLIDRDGVIVAGEGRVEAARALGVAEVPCLSFETMSEADRQRYFNANLKLALEAGWDEALLASELGGLVDRGTPIARAGDARTGEDTLPARSGGAPVTRPGDLWLLGDHRLLCGDATAAATYKRLMGAERAELVFTEPLCEAEQDLPGDAVSAADRGAALTSRLTSTFANLARYSSEGALVFVCGHWRHMRQISDAGEAVFDAPQDLIVWIKDPHGESGLCGSGHELVFLFQNRDKRARHARPDGQGANPRADVWRHRGVPDVRLDRLGEAAVLPSVRPVALVAEVMDENSEPGGVVLDAFCGSGTILVAAERTGRQARAVESQPDHCDDAIRRWQDYTGSSAILAETGESFEVITAQRTGGSA